MAFRIKVSAYANNEVAFMSWQADSKIPGCLGFEIFREYLDEADNVTEAVPLAAYVAFKGQSNPDWLPQNTSVWPVQKFSWRDLTLRKKRSEAMRRPDEVRVRYRIRPVAAYSPGLEKVTPRVEMTKGKANTYKGAPIELGYLGPPAYSNAILVTRRRAPFETTFTNGILSGQWLVRALTNGKGGAVPDGVLKAHLVKPNDRLRTYLSGDVIEIMRSFFAREGGRFHMALYELEDEELQKLIADNAERIDLILSNTGLGKDGDDDSEDAGKVWDSRNAPARAALVKIARKRGTKFTLQHRMFNNSIQIGHNKFTVWVDDQGVARSVLTGSTNWTWSGLTAQSNNCIRIDDDAVADSYLRAWRRLHDDELPLPDDFGDPMGSNKQGEALRTENQTPDEAKLTEGEAQIWFSPNMAPRKYPKDPDTPPDLDRLFSLMRRANHAIFFLAFYPSQQGKYSIIEEAVRLGTHDKSLNVVGAVSAEQAMFNYRPSEKTADGEKTPATAPYVYVKDNISVVRAAAVGDRRIMKPFGDFYREVLKAGIAIIHDKILVIDPLDPENCVVAFGSHNLGFKASYSNDENLVIVRGHKGLAEAYAVHVLDVYDHYRFRAAEAELRAEGKKGWDGFLSKKDDWQDHASKILPSYFTR